MNYRLVDGVAVASCCCDCLLLQNVMTDLMCAAVKGHKGVVHELLRAGANVNEKNKVSEFFTC